MMHPDIKAFWDKTGYQQVLLDGSVYCFNRVDNSARCLYNGATKLYWFYPIWSGNIGKWYTEQKMLKIIKLKRFI